MAKTLTTVPELLRRSWGGIYGGRSCEDNVRWAVTPSALRCRGEDCGFGCGRMDGLRWGVNSPR